MQNLMFLHSCFRTNRTVWRRWKRHGGLRSFYMQQVQRANRHNGLSETVKNCRTAVAFCTLLAALTVFLCVHVCVLLTTLPVLTYVNSGGRKRAGVRMTVSFIPAWQPAARPYVVKEVVVMTCTDVVWWEFFRRFQLMQAIYWLLKMRFFFLYMKQEILVVCIQFHLADA